MRERDWLSSTDPTAMLKLLKGKASDRKLVLLSATYLREVDHPSERERCQIDVWERFADERATWEEWAESWSQSPWEPALWAERLATNIWTAPGFPCLPRVLMSNLLREMFGNPFRPVRLDSERLTPTVVQLARGIYEDRAFDRMPILADALQDAGCENADVLNHCRDTAATHVRGCWVVDMLLGKS